MHSEAEPIKIPLAYVEDEDFDLQTYVEGLVCERILDEIYEEVEEEQEAEIEKLLNCEGTPPAGILCPPGPRKDLYPEEPRRKTPYFANKSFFHSKVGGRTK